MHECPAQAAMLLHKGPIFKTEAAVCPEYLSSEEPTKIEEEKKSVRPEQRGPEREWLEMKFINRVDNKAVGRSWSPPSTSCRGSFSDWVSFSGLLSYCCVIMNKVTKFSPLPKVVHFSQIWGNFKCLWTRAEPQPSFMCLPLGNKAPWNSHSPLTMFFWSTPFPNWGVPASLPRCLVCESCWGLTLTHPK